MTKVWIVINREFTKCGDGDINVKAFTTLELAQEYMARGVLSELSVEATWPSLVKDISQFELLVQLKKYPEALEKWYDIWNGSGDDDVAKVNYWIRETEVKTTLTESGRMDSCQDSVSFIIDSFLERPEEWDFGSFEHSFSANYATHKKSGFRLYLSNAPPNISQPDWACKYKFTKEEKKLLMAAIQPVRERAIAKARKKVANRIVRRLDPPEKPEQPCKKGDGLPLISLGCLLIICCLVVGFLLIGLGSLYF